MTPKQIPSRSLATLSLIAALAAGAAVTAAPSTARAEAAASQIIMSDGNISCPPCGFFKLYDREGLSFRDVVADVQDGELVITAQVVVAGTAGKPRIGSVVFSAFSADGSFMDYTDDACMPSLMSRQTGTQACDAVSGAFRDASAAAGAEGIIMRDGGICDPIRHMGC